MISTITLHFNPSDKRQYHFDDDYRFLFEEVGKDYKIFSHGSLTIFLGKDLCGGLNFVRGMEKKVYNEIIDDNRSLLVYTIKKYHGQTLSEYKISDELSLSIKPMNNYKKLFFNYKQNHIEVVQHSNKWFYLDSLKCTIPMENEPSSFNEENEPTYNSIWRNRRIIRAITECKNDELWEINDDLNVTIQNYSKKENSNKTPKNQSNLISHLDRNKQIFITLTSLRNIESLDSGTEIKLIKEPNNFYDDEAIRVELNSKKIGYVANSPNTVIKGTSSAGYIYDKINDEALAIIQFIKDKFVIAEVIQTKEDKDELEAYLDYLLGPNNEEFEYEELKHTFNGSEDKMNSKLDFINEVSIFKREMKEDDDFSVEPMERSSDKNKILKIQNLDDLTKIKRPIEFLTDEIDVVWPYIGNWCFLFRENNEIKIKTMDGFVHVNEFKTNFGPMIAVDRGEWGGTLYNITEKGFEQSGDGNFINVFEYNNKVFAITTLMHMSLRECSLHEIKKFEDRFEDIIIFESTDILLNCSYLEDNYLYFYSNPYNECTGLFRLNLDNYQIETICKDLFASIHVNCILKQNNLIYIYGNYNLMEYNLDTGEIEYFTNLEQEEISKLYVDNIKLSDLWEEYIL